MRKTTKNRVYIFSGLISCGECGSRMGGRVATKTEIRFYNCTAHYMNVSKCGSKANLTEKKIEEYLIETIREKMDRLKLETLELAPLEKVRDYPAEIAALRAKMKKVNRLYINEMISFEECKAENDVYTAQIEALEREAAQRQKPPDFTTAEELLTTGWETLYQNLTLEKKQEFWRMLIKIIRIYPDRHIEYDLNVF